MNTANSLTTVEELSQKPFIQQALANPTTSLSVLSFFFGTDLSKGRAELEAGNPILRRMQKLWFTPDPAYDELCQGFRDSVRSTRTTSLGSSRDDRMARLILTDQLSRNIFRRTPEAFEYDEIGMIIARNLVEDPSLPPPYITFVVTALTHSEDPKDHETSVELLENAANTYPDCKWWFDIGVQACLEHKLVIDRFGRYPHRNAVKGRTNTNDEEAWLNDRGNLPDWAKSQL